MAVSPMSRFNIKKIDRPLFNITIQADFADEKVITSSNFNAVRASQDLQTHLHLPVHWRKKWRNNINVDESSHATFTRRSRDTPSVILNDT